MDTYIARQPIFDKELRIFAYELLFRANGQSSSFEGVDADLASSSIVMESFQTIGIDAITGRKPAFINFTAKLLNENIATLFPKDQLVIEVLEDVDPTPEIVAVCRDLCDKGYTLALDDFVYRPALDPLIRLSRIIKFDFLASTPQQISQMLMFMAKNLNGKLLLAEKIETQEMFRLASDMGFRLFQGYFFSKPVTVASRHITPLQVSYMSLIREMNAGDEMDFERIARIIRRDVALCHKLLRMANSAYYGMRSEVTDIKRALTILGTKEIRKWIYLMSMAELNPGKPDELVKMSMIRGFFMEHMARSCRLGYSTENLFLTGLFSLIDVLMDQPMDSALSGMVLAPEVRETLLERKGRIYDLLQLVISLEKGEWNRTDVLTASFGVGMEQVSGVYLEAVKWCNEMVV